MLGADAAESPVANLKYSTILKMSLKVCTKLCCHQWYRDANVWYPTSAISIFTNLLRELLFFCFNFYLFCCRLDWVISFLVNNHLHNFSPILYMLGRFSTPHYLMNSHTDTVVWDRYHFCLFYGILSSADGPYHAYAIRMIKGMYEVGISVF